jgi:septum formation protein
VLTPRLPVVLASASPRRRELLARIFEQFEVIVPDVDEERLGKPDPWENAEHLACSKAFKVQILRAEKLVIGADTVVALPDAERPFRQFAKPQDPEHAFQMLSALSGKEHVVVTGVSLLWPDGRETWSTTSRVRFRELTEEEIRVYVATGEPLDKAGSYGAQDKGRALIAHIEGSHDNVIGLPTEDLIAKLVACHLAE